MLAATGAGIGIAAIACTAGDAAALMTAEDPVPWRDLAAGQAIDWSLLLLFVPIVMRLARSCPIDGAHRWAALAIHGLAIVALALAKLILFTMLSEALRVAGWPLADAVVASMPQNIVGLAALVGGARLVRIADVAPQNLPRHFVVRDVRGYRLVRPDEIVWVEAQGNYACLHTATGRHLIRSTMIVLEATLDPVRFVRVHRGAIVNADHVTRIDRDPCGGYRLSLTDGVALRGGRAYGERIAQLRI